ncbi:hypothetical protein SAMN04489727_8845 [Amycolatopsis tolypomycina]|uniref:Uncharacterized protein n=1 Tax=Amycolatopsis tolypomycina TaxID=208445 RepID=A0A1H5CL61_9PSEU|nr:hypothetical protein [Amycolatopsis tolypomycina]SED67393.1 hypothetical protein SAMN04489727_8845 [Amycolatopsis tolypomycina]
MKAVRVLLALPGLAALAWGAVLFAEYALPLRPDVYGTVTWLVGGPIVNDAVIAPLTALLGITLARRLPPRWRTPVTAGTVITATLAILAFPLLWRPYGTPPMPGLHDTDPTPGLALTVAAVWLTVVLTALTRRVVPPITSDAPPITRDTPPITRDTPPVTPGPALITPGPAPGTTADPPSTQPDRLGTQPDRPGTPTDPPGT